MAAASGDEDDELVPVDLVVIVAIIDIPWKLGGFGAIFDKVNHAAAVAPPGKAKPSLLQPALYNAYAMIALGSALALSSIRMLS